MSVLFRKNEREKDVKPAGQDKGLFQRLRQGLSKTRSTRKESSAASDVYKRQPAGRASGSESREVDLF